jgi:hypothetical protein
MISMCARWLTFLISMQEFFCVMEGMNTGSLGTLEYSSDFQCFHHTRLHGDAYGVAD